ncbi:MAG TPA: Gfo/Idh/MocA family oxidoreductase [Thermomicrobiales bacterium]|nr:Gfo/Idh/MocA family oxidoreductase [Thermomicrobiales bacterium]
MIGAGSMASRVHYPSLAALPGVEFAGICDLDPERLDQIGDRYGIERRFADYRRMIEAVAPDAVYAIGPPHHMYDIWVWCLRRGLNLFVEKPLGLTLHQARSLAHLAAENGCITQVGFQRRASPLANLLRDACLERGPIRQAVVRFYKNSPDPFLGAASHILDDGVHAIDTVRWLCGGELVDIDVVTRRHGTPDVNFVAAQMTFDTGAVGTLLNNWTSGRRIFGIEMHAPGICAEADIEVEGRLFADGDVAGVAYRAGDVAGGDDFYVRGGFLAKSAEFVAAIRENGLPSSHFGDAVKTMEIAERITGAALA